jgi:hypothetical protein
VTFVRVAPSRVTQNSRTVATSFLQWEGKLPSQWWGGHIEVGVPPNGKGRMYQHYLLFESERDPANDPVVLWYNGGPGASSLFGAFVELGPLLLNDDSVSGANAEKFHATGIPQLVRNPYAWSKVANVVIVDNPSPVGFVSVSCSLSVHNAFMRVCLVFISHIVLSFTAIYQSYCTPAGPTGDGTSCGDWNDGLVANANHAFVTDLIKVFPEFAANGLYITGESYAGVYVPTMVQKLMQDPRGVNLKGFAGTYNHALAAVDSIIAYLAFATQHSLFMHCDSFVSCLPCLSSQSATKHSLVAFLCFLPSLLSFPVGDGCMGTDVLCGGHDEPYYQVRKSVFPCLSFF